METKPQSMSDADGVVLTPERELQLLRQAVESLPVGLSLFGADDRLLLCNQRFRELWSLDEDVARPGASFADVTSGTDVVEIVHPDGPSLPLCEEGTRRREWLTGDGRTVEVVVRRRADGSTVALHEDVTAKRSAQRRIAWLAGHDILTGLANRAVLRDTLQRLLDDCDASACAGVLYVDLDRFKAVNDAFGHAAGDELLRHVARRLEGCCHSGAVVARLGGDEFAIIAPALTDAAHGCALGKRIIAALSEPFALADAIVRIGASVGVCIAPADGTDVDTLLRRADLALYRSKADGRGACRRFEHDMEAAKVERKVA